MDLDNLFSDLSAISNRSNGLFAGSSPQIQVFQSQEIYKTDLEDSTEEDRELTDEETDSLTDPEAIEPEISWVTFTQTGLPEGFERTNIGFVYLGYPSDQITTGILNVVLVEQNPNYENAENVFPIIDGVREIQSLPVYMESEDSWYIAKPVKSFPSTVELEFMPIGSGGGRCPIQLFSYKRPGTDENTPPEVWATLGNIAGLTENDVPGYSEDGPEGWFIASSGSGNVYIEITVDQETGSNQAVSADFVIQDTAPETPQDGTKIYVPIGSFEYDGNSVSITPDGGSISLQMCRNWFAAESPFFGVNYTKFGCGESSTY